MKKIILTFGLAIVFFISTILLSFGQINGSTCSNAIPIIPKDSCVSTQFQFIDPGLEMWFSFVATATGVRIDMTEIDTTTAHIHTLSLFEGTCQNLTLLSKKDIFTGDSTFTTDAGQSFLVINAGDLIVGNTYFIKLEIFAVAICPRCKAIETVPIFFGLCVENISLFKFGLPHIPVGNAILSSVGNTFVASGMGSSGNDGFSIEMGNVGGIRFKLPPFDWTTLPSGAFIKTENIRISGLKTSMLEEKIGNKVRISHDFSEIGATARAVDVFLNGQLVTTIVHTNTWDFELDADDLAKEVSFHDCSSNGPGADGTAVIAYHWVTIIVPDAVRLSNGDVVQGDMLMVRPVNAIFGPEPYSKSTMTFKDFPTFTILEELIVKFDYHHKALGEAIFEPADGALTISNIGQNVVEGVRVELGEDESYRMEWNNLDPAGIVPNGAILKVSAVGSVEGTRDSDIGDIEVEKVGSTLAITPDFTPIQSNTHRLEVFSNGVLVATVTDHAGIAAIISSTFPQTLWPSSFTVLSGGSATSGFVAIWPELVNIAIPGEGTFTGDKFRVLAESETIDFIQTFTVQASDISSITIINESPKIITCSDTVNVPDEFDATVFATPTGGLPAFSFSWSNGATTSQTSVTADDAPFVTVASTDAETFTVVDTIFINLIDVSCGNNKDKVIICHKDNIICISKNAVSGHLAHGDRIGSCDLPDDCSVNNNFARIGNFEEDEDSKINKELRVIPTVYPNPFSNSTTIKFSVPETGIVIINIFNLTGTRVITLFRASLKTYF